MALCADELGVTYKLKYLVGWITSGSGVRDEITTRITRASVVFTSLRYSWRSHDVRLSLKGKVY